MPDLSLRATLRRIALPNAYKALGGWAFPSYFKHKPPFVLSLCAQIGLAQNGSSSPVLGFSSPYMAPLGMGVHRPNVAQCVQITPEKVGVKEPLTRYPVNISAYGACGHISTACADFRYSAPPSLSLSLSPSLSLSLSLSPSQKLVSRIQKNPVSEADFPEFAFYLVFLHVLKEPR